LGNPLKAKISIAGYDIDSSEIFSEYRSGTYHRMLAPGTYSLTFTAANYLTKTIQNVSVAQNNTTYLDVVLSSSIVPVELISFNASVDDDGIVLNWQTAAETNNSGFEIERKESGE
jgi:hypothetical protein